MKMRTAVVTGVTGFLGYALLLELLQNGYFVYALCRKNSKRIDRLEGLNNVDVIETDLSIAEEIPSVKHCDIFFHLAWEGGRNHFDEQYKNVEMTLNCLRLAARFNAGRFLCTGSQAEYGEVTGVITEDTVTNPVTSYGAAKVAAYYLAKDLAKRMGISFVWARVFSVYGEHDNLNSLIPQLLKSLRENGTAKLVTDGLHIWNYLYEADAARALRLLGESATDGIFNVASAQSKLLREYVRDISTNIMFGDEKSAVNLNVSVDKLFATIGTWEMADFKEIIKEKCENG